MSSSPLPRSVRRALDAMRADPGRNWRLGDLATVAGVSPRTLQRQFRSFLGKSPRAVQFDLGFEQARRELIRATPRTTVTDVALRCGFSHGGRFSIEYRRRYAESPSQTLRRQARLAAVLDHTPLPCVPSRDRPQVAIATIETDAAYRELADGITADLAAAMTQAGVAVVRSPSSARYRLSGTICGGGAETRLLLRLLDADTGLQLWAHRTDDVLRDDAPAEHLATRIVASLQPQLRLAEIERAQARPVAELSAQGLALRALPGVIALDADGNARALDLLMRAMEIDPGHGLAVALAAWAHAQRIVYYFASDPAAERARALELATRAQALGGDATVLAVLGNALTLLGELDAAGPVIARALAVDGGSAWAWGRSGWIDVYRGDPESAIERFRIALDLAPHDQIAFNNRVGIGCACFGAGRYAEAAHWQAQALAEHPSAMWVHRTLSPFYLLAGQGTEARRSLSALRRYYPDLTVGEAQSGMPPLPRQDRDVLLGALCEIGLPA